MKLLILTALLTGCNGEPLFGGKDGVDTDEVPDTTPRITVTAPAAGGQYYGDSVTVDWEVANFTVDLDAAGTPNEEGVGHVHAYVDDVLVGEAGGTSYTFTDLPSGTHTLEVRLAENDHTELWEGSWVYLDTLDSKIAIVSPPDGTPLTASSVPLTLSITDFEVSRDVAFGDPQFGKGRYVIELDGEMVDFGMDPTTFEVTQLAEGSHDITVELVAGDGMPLDPPVEDTVTVEVLPGSPYIAMDRRAFLEPYNSATVPLSVSVANADLDYHVYLDTVFYVRSIDPEVTIEHLAPGFHTVETRLVSGGSELPIHDQLTVFVTEERPDITVTYPGDQWGVAPNFDVTVAVENFQLVNNFGGANADGQGHWAVLVDGVPGDESASDTASLVGLLTGPHTLRVQLQNNDRSPLDPPVYEDITVDVQ